MRNREDVVAAVIEAAGGKLIGRVRLQKVFYLLDALGLNSRFDYEYHHYGPYSAELSAAMADARAFGLVDEDLGFRASDGVPYSIYKTKTDVEPKKAVFGYLGEQKTRLALEKLRDMDATVLELAATIHWLRVHERIGSGWKEELIRRKGMKTRGGRIDDAVALLRELSLWKN